MSRTPNHEQKKAIEHSGGVLLSAGAGSGKTFVLVEHIIYLAKNWQSECMKTDPFGRSVFLQKKFSEIVLMTFTKEAAGELSYRLQKRIEEEIQNQESESYWELVSDNVSFMTLTTIHGFCAKLLSQGFIIDFDPQVKLLSEIEFRDKIKQLIDQWFERESINEERIGFMDLVVTNKDNLLDAFCKIFSDAKLRQMWGEFDPQKIYQDDISHILKDIFELEEIEKALFPISLTGLEAESKKAWYKNIEAYNDFISGLSLDSMESIDKFLGFFTTVKRWAVPPAKLGLDEITDYVQKAKELKKFLNDYREDLYAYFVDGKDEFINWISATHCIFKYIESHYMDVTGINFSDYEYYVLKGLENSTVASNISSNFRYLIVDEFQDTSQVQFEIIDKIIEGDFGRLFCVGDIKQAIYGFRGGEIAVFEKCKELIPINLELNNNYRSHETIVKYNNTFFNHIFHKGLKYQSSDRFSVDVVPQVVPAEVVRDVPGAINHLEVSLALPEKQKLLSEDISKIEAEVIVDQIENLIQNYPGEDICVLYSKLTPLKFLLQKLLERNIGFVSQVKINIDEDPLLGIFKHLLEYELLPEKTEEQLKIKSEHIATILKYLGFEQGKLESVAHEVQQFHSNVLTLGLYLGLEKIFYNLGISNSSHVNNTEMIHQICILAMDDVAKAWLILKESSRGNYSVRFQCGDSNVAIMTVHSSKGLEFDHVLLGGIHTNGKGMPPSEYFGTLPGSFRWKKESAQSKAFYSPELLLEKALSKRKDFSESKRLFYVANTRAIKTLNFVHLLDANTGEVIIRDENSWIKAIDSFDGLTVGVERIQVDYQFSQLEDAPSNDRPLFHLDQLGNVERPNIHLDTLACIPELSVTRLTTLADCPTKFYLQNICKFTPDEPWLQEIGLELKKIDENLIRPSEDKNIEETFTPTGFSRERGIEMHDILHQVIVKDIDYNERADSKKDLRALDWAREELASLSDKNNLVSEVPIKFSFFGTMISGTPDLVVEPKTGEDSFKIVDFKTGVFSTEKSNPYWFQLKIYAYALYCMGRCSESDEVQIELWFIDEQKKYTQTLGYTELHSDLLRFWKKLTDLSVKNTQHCSSCNFGNLCHFGSDSFASIL